MRARFVFFQIRDALVVGVPILLILAGTAWFLKRFVDPAPPTTFVVSAATPGSPYYRFAERYQGAFKRNGVALKIRESQGSFDNLKALADPAAGVQAGFVQGGLTSAKEVKGLQSVGRIAYEPLWVFYTGDAPLERLSDLKGKRVLVGPEGSGTGGLAMRLLAANGITAETATLIYRQLPDYVDMLSNGEADAGFLVLAPEARTIQRLLRAPRVRLMSFANAESYMQRFPFLSRLVLREGVVDLAANLPPADVTLIATTAAVLVREDAHPALVNLLAQAIQEVHGQPVTDTGGDTPLFQRAGVFPIASDPEFALAEEARRVYRSGAPLLQRYVPFWVATMIDRLTVSLVVLLPVLLPLVRFAPQLYNWRIRRRILYWYGELKRLEAAARRAGTQQNREANLTELDRIELAVDNIPVPLAFSDKLYELRQHIEVVRRRLDTGARHAAAEAA